MGPAMRGNLLTILTVGGVIIGSIVGLIVRASSTSPWTEREVSYVYFVGDIFLRMLKALILPLIMSSLIVAVGSLDLTLSGKIGARAVAYYMITTVMAVVLGIILSITIQPGKRFGAGENAPEGRGESRNITITDTLLDLLR